MIYTFYQQFPLGEDRSFGLVNNEAKIVAVPEQTAFWAIVAPPIWLAWHRLWFHLAIYLIIVGGLFTLLTTPYWLVPALLGGLPGVYLWLEGHQLRRNNLEAHGYELTHVIEAPDEKTALARVIADHRPLQPIAGGQIEQISTDDSQYAYTPTQDPVPA